MPYKSRPGTRRARAYRASSRSIMAMYGRAFSRQSPNFQIYELFSSYIREKAITRDIGHTFIKRGWLLVCKKNNRYWVAENPDCEGIIEAYLRVREARRTLS